MTPNDQCANDAREDDAMREPRTDPAIMRASVALKDLRDAMTDVRYTVPTHMPGHGPTAADNCKQILDMMDWNVRQIAVYLQVPLDA